MISDSDAEVTDPTTAHLREWSDLARHVQVELPPALIAQRELIAGLTCAIQAQIPALDESVRAITESAIQSIRVLQPEFEGIANEAALSAARAIASVRLQMPQITDSVAAIIDGFRESMAPAFAQLAETFRVLPAATQRAIATLGVHGWYFDLDMSLPALWELERALNSGEDSEVEQALCEYFENALDAIELRLSRTHPRRAYVLSAAFAAHRRGEYVLSIPVLLSQADGICEEVTSQHLYGTRDNRPRTAEYVELFAAGGLQAALLSPLVLALPIRASRSERDSDSQELYRHAILHGESCDYGTRVNGLKAVSLVNYISAVLDCPAR